MGDDKPFFGARQKYIFGLWPFFDKKIEFFEFFSPRKPFLLF
jgi:hypothetical protein